MLMKVLAIVALLTCPVLALPTTQPTSQDDYSYLGKPISTAQFGRLYREFRSKLVMFKGELVDIGEQVAAGNAVQTIKGRVVINYKEEAGRPGASPASMTYGNDALLMQPTGVRGSVMIRGIDEAVSYPKNSAATFLSTTFIGPTDTADGKRMTCLVGTKEPTVAEFSDALRKGFSLYEYSVRSGVVSKSQVKLLNP